MPSFKHKDLAEARDRARGRGRGRSVEDLRSSGMLYGRMLLSPVHHGYIKNLDLTKALAIPGVKAAVCGADCPGSLIPEREVIYAGEPVAAVAAVSPELAEKALHAITVEYEELPAVLDWDQALLASITNEAEQKAQNKTIAAQAKDDGREAQLPDLECDFQSPHPDLFRDIEPAPDLNGALIDDRRLAYSLQNQGDVDQAFAGAALVLENTFELPAAACMGPSPWACLAEPHGGGLTLWTSTAYSQDDDYYEQDGDEFGPEAELAQAAGLPDPDQVEIISLAQDDPQFFTDGDFPPAWELLAAALAVQSGRPVRISLNRAEEAVLAPRSPAMRVRSKLGLDQEGNILAHDMIWDLQSGEVVADEGQASWLAMSAGLSYAAPSHRRLVRSTCANLPPWAELAGLDTMACQWALESQLNQAAQKLGLDPLEIRRINLQETGAFLGFDPYEPEQEEQPDESDSARIELPENRLAACLEYAARQGWSQDESRSLSCFSVWDQSDYEAVLFCGVLSLKADLDLDSGMLKVSEMDLVHSGGAQCDFSQALMRGLNLALIDAATNRPLVQADAPLISQTGLGNSEVSFVSASPAIALIPALGGAVARACQWVPGQLPLNPENILRGMGKILG